MVPGAGPGKKPVVLRADFDDAALKTPADVLLRFRSQVLQQYGKAMFPLFDVAMLRLSQKYGRHLPPDEQKEMLTDNPVISFALDVVGDFTGAGLLIGAAQTAARVGQSVARALTGWKGIIRRANAEITRMDAPELEQRLPWYFAMDVNAMNLPLVCVYLDTYEKMTARADCVAHRYPQARLWQRQGIEIWKALGPTCAARCGESLAGLADILWEQMTNQPAGSKENEDNAPKGWEGWQALRDFCREAIGTCENLGSGLDAALVRLWERRARAEDKLEAWDAAVAAWEQVLELGNCREAVEAYTAALGLEYSGTYEAKNLQALACEMAGRPEEAVLIREKLWQGYDRLGDPASREEALRQNYLLIRDNQLAGRWQEAINLQPGRPATDCPAMSWPFSPPKAKEHNDPLKRPHCRSRRCGRFAALCLSYLSCRFSRYLN